jgi:putative addiction module component (TIGR02574 family)
MAQSKLPTDVEQIVLSLSADDRLALAARLVDSVDDSDPAWTKAWTRELERLDADANAHPEQDIPWPIARAQLEALLPQKP